LGTDRDALIVDGVSGSNGDRVLQQVVQFGKATFFPGWHGSRWDRQSARFLRGAREGRFSNEPVVVSIAAQRKQDVFREYSAGKLSLKIFLFVCHNTHS
jgi:hypothetical protein